MSTVLEQLIVELKAEVGGLTAGMNSAKSAVKDFRATSDKETAAFQAAMLRARTAVLSLGAAWAGINLGRSIVDAGIQMQALNAKMGAATGNAAVAAESLKFVREEAQRLGLDFKSTADGFASFAASALRSGLTFEETKNIFTGVSEAATGMRLSAERTSLVFTALSQMASKGTVSMEELKQQLGESLPGALQVFAKAMGVPNAQFIKMIENGQVTTRDLIKLGEGLRKDFGGAAQEAARGAQAAFNRFGNALFDLRTRLANSGLLDAVVKGVESLTRALNDPQLVSGLSQLVSFLSKVMEVAIRVASAIGSVVGAVNRAVEAVGNSAFGSLFGKEGSDALTKARGGGRVSIPVKPTFVDENYTLGKTSAPGMTDAQKRAQAVREQLRQRVAEQNAGLITEGDPNKVDSAQAVASLEKRYLDEQELLEKALEKKAITEQEFKENQLKVELDYQARLAEIRQQYRDDFLSDEQAFAEGVLGVQLGMQNRSLSEQGKNFRSSIQQAAQYNKTFFELEKAAAIAQAMIKARQSVVDAYQFGMRISGGNPLVGAAVASVAAAAQAANISAIASTSFGGGGAVSTSGGGGGGSGEFSGSSGGDVAPVGPQRSITVNLTGADWTIISKNDIRKLIDRLNDAGADNSQFTFAGA